MSSIKDSIAKDRNWPEVVNFFMTQLATSFVVGIILGSLAIGILTNGGLSAAGYLFIPIGMFVYVLFFSYFLLTIRQTSIAYLLWVVFATIVVPIVVYIVSSVDPKSIDEINSLPYETDLVLFGIACLFPLFISFITLVFASIQTHTS